MATYHIEAGQSALIVGPAKIDLVADDPPVIGVVDAPSISALNPNTAVAGDAEDIEMVVNGTGFNELSKITFGGNDEPTTLLSPTQVRTIVKPSVFPSPDDVPVAVRNGGLLSNELQFTFSASAARGSKAKHDDHREERSSRRR